MSSSERLWLTISAVALVILVAIWGWDCLAIPRGRPTVTMLLRARPGLDPFLALACAVPGALILGHLYGEDSERMIGNVLVYAALSIAALVVGSVLLSG
jgi:hypothetical protein